MTNRPALRMVALTGALLLSGCDPGPRPMGEEPLSTRAISFQVSEGTALGFDLSPDGETIVFDLLGQLWTLPAEGGEARPLTDAVRGAAEDLDPSFSPDGRWVAFSGDRGGVAGVWLVSAEGGESRLAAATEQTPPIWREARPAWSPDGQRIAFSDTNRLHVHHLGSDSTWQVELTEPVEGPLHPAWLPDGRVIIRASPGGMTTGDPSNRLRVIDPMTGEGEDLDTGGRDATVPASSPDGTRVAYIADDEGGRPQVWVQGLGPDAPVRLTDESHMSPVRVRWTADGRGVLYSAEGRLWTMALDTRGRRAIPFHATVRFERHEPDLPAVAFPEPDGEIPARGHTGLALSAGGDRIALIALGKLWLWRIGEEPEPVRDVPPTAGWLSWAPDESRVVWSAGPGGAEDLYVTDLESGRTRRLTALPGQAYRPMWSPDGEHIAFIYWPTPAFPGSERPEDQRGHFAVVSADVESVSDRSDVLLLGEVTNPGRWLWIPGPMVQEVPAWTPQSDALLYPPTHGPGWRARWWQPPDGEWRLLPLEGEPRPVGRVPEATTFLQWAPHSGLVYVHATQLWRAELQEGAAADPVRLTEEAALYPSVARDGTILYVGEGGYRLRRPEGAIESLGWSLSFRAPSPERILIREARIIPGTGAPPGASSDLLLEAGRIAAIAPAGGLGPEQGAKVIEAEGRFLLPGLIDLHVHGSEYAVYAASLYFGVTTIRESGAPIAWKAALRDMFDAGVASGPRVVLGGPQINPGERHPLSGSSVQNPGDLEDMRRTLTLLEAFGASYAKMRGPRNWSAGAKFVREAHRRGIRVSGHCAYPLPLVAAGLDHKEHGGDCRYAATPRDDLIQLYRAAGVSLVPTLANSSVWSGRAGPRGAISSLDDAEVDAFLTPALRFFGGYDTEPPDRSHDEEAWKERLAELGRAHEAGLPVASGTDEWYLPGAIHLELEELVASGLSPLEAITAATGTAARLLGAGAEIGRIQEGKRADLILLDADPLDDIRNTRRIWKVIRGGEVVDRQALLEGLGGGP